MTIQWKNEVNFVRTSPNRIEYNYGPRSVATCDFNNDNRLDIVTCNTGDDDVSVLLGYDNGTFMEQQRFAIGSSS